LTNKRCGVIIIKILVHLRDCIINKSRYKKMKIQYPDYDNSILSAASSVLKYYGAEHKHKSLPVLDKALEKRYKNIVFMVFDGMGMSVMKKNLEKEGFFFKNTVAEISSVFPPTTTAATTTFDSGLSPLEHGWLGWCLYFEELDANINLYPNTIQGSGGVPAADYNAAMRYLPYINIRDKIVMANKNIDARIVAPFADYNINSVFDICSSVKSICSEEKQKYIYAYWHEPDGIMHQEGTGSISTKVCINDIETQVREMCGELADTLVIVTADHGMKDTETIRLSDFPEILSCLVRLPSVEPRAMTFFIKEGCRRKFEKVFIDAFGKDYVLMTKEEVFDKALFGFGDIHPRTKGFIGDYMAVAVGSVSIEVVPSDALPKKALHAGLTYDEMAVPLILIDCDNINK